MVPLPLKFRRNEYILFVVKKIKWTYNRNADIIILEEEEYGIHTGFKDKGEQK